jgi:hypothetical protein
MKGKSSYMYKKKGIIIVLKDLWWKIETLRGKSNGASREH